MKINTNNIIIYNKNTKKPSFLHKNNTQEDVDRLKKDNEVVVFEVGDTVTFQSHSHFEEDGQSKLKTGIIKKMGWSASGFSSSIVCGVKVEGEPFGSALLYNYTIHPISLTKVQK